MSFVKGSKYDFNTKAPTVLGESHHDMVVTGVDVDYSIARYIVDAEILHAELRLVMNLPPLEECNFILFEDSNKNKRAFITDTIDYNSIVAVDKQLYQFIIEGSSNDMIIIQNAIKELGYMATYKRVNS